MTGAPLRFFFDFVSPYAFLAWTQIHAVAARRGRAVEPVPVLFAALLNDNGQKGPAEIPRKRVYVFKDCVRTAHRLGVAFGPPPSHPFNPLLALRVASLPAEPEIKKRLVDGLFAATWGGGDEGVTDAAVVAAIAARAGLDGPRAIAEATSAEGKERVRVQTEEALALGAFGVPSIVADGELFWGLDALPNLDMVLEHGDALARDAAARWAALPSSAAR